MGFIGGLEPEAPIRSGELVALVGWKELPEPNFDEPADKAEEQK